MSYNIISVNCYKKVFIKLINCFRKEKIYEIKLTPGEFVLYFCL